MWRETESLDCVEHASINRTDIYLYLEDGGFDEGDSREKVRILFLYHYVDNSVAVFPEKTQWPQQHNQYGMLLGDEGKPLIIETVVEGRRDAG